MVSLRMIRSVQLVWRNGGSRAERPTASFRGEAASPVCVPMQDAGFGEMDREVSTSGILSSSVAEQALDSEGQQAVSPRCMCSESWRWERDRLCV